jgi:hypothetical protein
MRSFAQCPVSVAAQRDQGRHDPGVLVSAFISPSKAAPALLIEAVLDGKLDLVVSESTDVLVLEKFAAHAARRRTSRFALDRANISPDAPTP